MSRKLLISVIAVLIIALPTFSFAYSQSEEKAGVNNSGQTFGTVFDVSDKGSEPDLIYALANNGKYGYLRSEDLLNLGPSHPDDTDYEKRVFGNKNYCELNVYASDGVTVIGKFRVDR